MTKTPPDQKAFWDWLARQQAERQDMSLRQVALQAGLSVSTLYQRRIYGGQPSLLTCRKLAAFFDFDEDYVLTLAGHRPAVPNYDLRQVLRALYPLAPARLIDQALGALNYVLGPTDPAGDRPQPAATGG